MTNKSFTHAIIPNPIHNLSQVITSTLTIDCSSYESIHHV